MKLLRKIKWWFHDHGWLFVVIFYWAAIIYSGYAIGGAIKEWAKTHVIIVKEIK